MQLFLCNKYTVFTMGGTVALRSVNDAGFFFPVRCCSAAMALGTGDFLHTTSYFTGNDFSKYTHFTSKKQDIRQFHSFYTKRGQVPVM